ncbi:hypothetical protein FV228_25305 [Methylobacterium sp. WL18]|nr:hypothetical protein FV228_25305 [Methylobacterium sp. WL18]
MSVGAALRGCVRGISYPLPSPEVPAPAGLEGALQKSLRSLEPSFEAPASLRHLMRRRIGDPWISSRVRCLS